MANMSYCRWNNTYLDLDDCVSNMQFWLEDNPGKTWNDYVNQLPTQEEKVMFGRLMKKAQEFLDVIEHYSEEEEEEDVDRLIAEGERNSNEIDLAWSEMGLKSDR